MRDQLAQGAVNSRSRNLGIVFIGDSHFNGNQQKAATVNDTSGNIGTLALASPLDKMWNGAADATFFQADCQINSLSSPSSSNDQAQTAMVANRAGPIIDMLTCLRRAYPRLGRIRIANLAAGGSSTYTWAGERAQGYIAALGAPNDGDTITLGSVTYTFRTTASAANEVNINGAGGSILNLAKAVNAESGHGQGTGTVANPDVVSLNPVSTVYGRFYAKAVGTAGNSIVFSGGNVARVTAVTEALAATASRTLSSGSATSALYANGISRMTGFGRVDLVFSSLGTNDAQRTGIRGTDTQACYQTIVNNLKADFPFSKIIPTRPFYSRNTTTQTALTNTVIPAIDAIVAANSDVIPGTVDLWSLGLGTGDTTIVESLGQHGTQYGYSVMSQLMAIKGSSALSLV
jgi:hypothetical protein